MLLPLEPCAPEAAGVHISLGDYEGQFMAARSAGYADEVLRTLLSEA